jgi:pyrrolidone-carboxylate peptidase
MSPLLLVTGFGPFEEVVHNPSAALARALAERPPAGFELRSAILPVSFLRAPRAWDELFETLPRAPGLLLGLGSHKEGGFRLERRARGRLCNTVRVDVDGVVAASASGNQAHELASPLDLERVAAALQAAGAEQVTISEDAGGYVCERVYHHLLQRGREHGVAGLFVHVPPEALLPVREQERILRKALADLAEITPP